MAIVGLQNYLLVLFFVFLPRCPFYTVSGTNMVMGGDLINRTLQSGTNVTITPSNQTYPAYDSQLANEPSTSASNRSDYEAPSTQSAIPKSSPAETEAVVSASKKEKTSATASVAASAATEIPDELTVTSEEICSFTEANMFFVRAPVQRVLWDSATCSKECSPCKFAIRVDDDQGIMLEFSDLQFHDSKNKARLDVICPTCPTDLNVTAPQTWRIDDAPSVERVIVNEKKLVVRVKDPDASMKFVLNYTALDLNSLPVVDRLTLPGVCNSTYIPEQLRCDKVVHCEDGADEVDCEYMQTGCDSGWILHGDLCYRFVFKSSVSPAETHTDCVRNNKGLVAAYMDNDTMSFAANIVIQQGYEDIVVGVERVQTDIKELRHMYRFQWWWPPYEAVVFDSIMSTEGQGALEGCVLVHLAPPYFELRQVSCTEQGRFAYACFTESLKAKSTANQQSELKLSTVTRPPDKFPTKRCDDGSFVHLFHPCHGAKPGLPADTWPALECENGLKVHYTLACDGVDDCGDFTDEDKCDSLQRTKLKDYFFCKRRTEAVSKYSRCNGILDCYDGSDEEDCPFCRQDTVYYFGLGCLPKPYFQQADCSAQETTQPATNASYAIAPECQVNTVTPPQGVVQVDLDGFGMARLTILDDAKDCPETHVLCANSSCIPIYMVNNGQHDCPYPNTDDEMEPGKFDCNGYYRCYRHEICLHNDHLCDGVYHCPLRDDERYCDLPTPASCTRQGHALTCRNESDLDLESELFRYLDLSGSYRPTVWASHYLSYLQFLNLSSCSLPNVSLSLVRQLKVLDLHNNNFVGLAAVDLKDMDMLVYLDLSHNPRLFEEKMSLKQFLQVSGFKKLQNLYLTNTGLTNIEPQTFLDINKLRYLDITKNNIKVVNRLMFDGLKRPKELNTDEYRLCCSYYYLYPDSKAECNAPVDELSSCTDLLRSTFFRVFLWVLAMLAVLGNVGVLVYRMFLQNYGASSGYRVFVSGLCLADLVMGVYLSMIGAADARYSGQYLWRREEWTASPACTAAGFLGLLSSEVSALTICLITLDRLLVLKFPLHLHLHLKARSGLIACLVIWATGLLIAAVPLLPFADGWDFYSQTGICLPLPITQRQFPGQHYAFAVFIVLNFALFCLIGAGQLLIYQTIRSTRQAAKTQRRNQDLAVARRLFVIVLSDFCCWFPVGVMGLLAVTGTPIPEEVNVWTAIFILPLNSALNPFLYTFNTLLDRRHKREEERRVKVMMTKLHVQVSKWPLDKVEDLYKRVGAIRQRLVEANAASGTGPAGYGGGTASATSTPSRSSISGETRGMASITTFSTNIDPSEHTGFDGDFLQSCQVDIPEKEEKELNSFYENGDTNKKEMNGGDSV